jgi:hypothetical protein
MTMRPTINRARKPYATPVQTINVVTQLPRARMRRRMTREMSRAIDPALRQASQTNGLTPMAAPRSVPV